MLNGLHIMTVCEFDAYMDGLREKVHGWKEEGLGYISVKCELANEITKNAGSGRERMYTETQLREIFDLAK